MKGSGLSCHTWRSKWRQKGGLGLYRGKVESLFWILLSPTWRKTMSSLGRVFYKQYIILLCATAKKAVRNICSGTARPMAYWRLRREQGNITPI